MERPPLSSQPPAFSSEETSFVDWANMTFRDEELGAFLEKYESAPLLPSGERLIAATPLELVEDIARVDEEKAVDLVRFMGHQGMLPEVSLVHVEGGDSEKEKASERLRQQWHTAKDRLSLFSGEEEKTKIEEAIIAYANSALDELRADYHLPVLSIPQEAAHLTDEVPFAHPRFIGEFSPYRQSIHCPRDQHPVQKMATLLHEMTHAKSYGALFILRDDEGVKIRRCQTGLSTPNEAGDGQYFVGLNEAVTEETANRLMREIPEEHPTLGALAKWTRDKTTRHTHSRAEHLQKGRVRPYWLFPFRTQDGSYQLASSYTKERHVMEDIFNKLYDRNPALFAEKTREETQEELFVLLQEAMFTGDISSFRQLFDSTFGEGKFAAYGRTRTIEEQQQFVGAL